MKKKFIVLLLSVVLCLPLAACGGEKKAPTKKMNISEYAETLDRTYSGVAVNYEPSAYTQARALDGAYVDATQAGVVILKAGNSDFRLYDVKGDAKVQEGTPMSSAPQIFGEVFIRSVNNGATRLYDLSGTQTVLESATYPVLGVDTAYYYLPGKYTQSRIYKLTYNTDTTSADKIKYFSYESPDGIAAPVLTEVAESDLRTTSAMNIPGSTVSATDVSDIYPASDGKPDADLKGYGYGVQTNADYGDSGNFTVYFYNNGKQSGSVQVKNGYRIGFIGKYFYFAEIELLPFDAEKGYNVFIQNGSSFTSSEKLNVTCYRYDVLKNKKSKFDPGYFIVPGSVKPLYNYSKGVYNAAELNGVNFVDGIATVTDGTPVKTFVVDQDCKVGFDLTDKPFTLDGIKNLNNGKFLITSESGYFITDSSLGTVASMPASSGAKLYGNSGVITYRHQSGRYMAVDFNGSVVINPHYRSLDFYGGVAYTDVTDGTSNNGANGVLVPANGEAATPLDIVGEGDRLLYGNDGVFMKYNATSKTLTVYNYLRNVIMTVPELNSQPQVILRAIANTNKAVLTVNNQQSYLLF